MHLSPSLLLITLTTLLTPSLAQSTNNSATATCLQFPPAIFGNQTFDPKAISGLSQALAKNTFNPPLPSDGIHLKAGAATRIGYAANGGYQICLQNFYFFKSLTVSLEDASAVVDAIQTTCCGTTPNTGPRGRQGLCQDAKASVTATDGSVVKVVGQDYGDRCCGMFICSD